jgi:hypothetical protein
MSLAGSLLSYKMINVICYKTFTNRIRKDTMYKLNETILTKFRSCFKRNSTFECFVIIVRAKANFVAFEQAISTTHKRPGRV